MNDKKVRNILLVLIGNRKESSLEVQKLLTEFGCHVKTRLGLHESSTDFCSQTGLIILELTEDDKKAEELAEKLDIIEDVNVKYIPMSLND